MHMYVHVQMYVRVYVHVHVHERVYVHVCVSVFVREYTCTCMLLSRGYTILYQLIIIKLNKRVRL